MTAVNPPAVQSNFDQSGDGVRMDAHQARRQCQVDIAFGKSLLLIDKFYFQ
jgi:hypothetical protein